MIRNAFLHFIFCFIGFDNLYAATTVDLQQAQKMVESNSPKLQKVLAISREASAKTTEASSIYLPTLQLTTSYLGGHRYVLTDVNLGSGSVSVPGVVPTSQLTLQANYLLFDGFASTSRYRATLQLEEAAKADLDWTRFQIIRDVTMVYYKAVAANALKEVAEKNLKTLMDHLNEVELFRKAGVSTNYDVLRVQVQVSDAQSEVLNSIDNFEIAKSRLVEVLGGELVTPNLSELPSLTSDISNSVGAKDFENRLDIRAGLERVEASQKLESAAGRFLVPKISLFGQYQYYNNINDRFMDTDRYRDAYQYGILLSWNLFDGLVSQSRSKQAVEQRIQSEQTHRAAILHAQQEIELWKRKFNYYCTVARSKKVDVERSIEAVRLAREGHKVGSRTNTELLDVESDLFRSRASLVNAQMGAVESLINLELASGKTLYSWTRSE